MYKTSICFNVDEIGEDVDDDVEQIEVLLARIPRIGEGINIYADENDDAGLANIYHDRCGYYVVEDVKVAYAKTGEVLSVWLSIDIGVVSGVRAFTQPIFDQLL